MWEETDVAFAIRKGVKNTNMRYLPKLLFSSSLFRPETLLQHGALLIMRLTHALAYVIFVVRRGGRFAPCYSMSLLLLFLFVFTPRILLRTSKRRNYQKSVNFAVDMKTSNLGTF